MRRVQIRNMQLNLKSAVHEVRDAFEANELFQRNGWTDGLPIVAPTEAGVVRFLQAARLSPGNLEAYLAAVDFHPKAGICLDTCHVFAAGEPLDEAGGTTRTVDRIVEIGGPGRLRLIHANDSMDVRGAFKDRHQKIGQGHIGLGAFEELFAHPATAGVPFVLETPGSRDVDDPDIGLLKKIRASVVPSPAGAGPA